MTVVLFKDFHLSALQDYNAFPEDMRSDEEAKAELHQRVEVRYMLYFIDFKRGKVLFWLF